MFSCYSMMDKRVKAENICGTTRGVYTKPPHHNSFLVFVRVHVQTQANVILGQTQAYLKFKLSRWFLIICH